MTEQTSEPNEKKPKTPKHRSPNYPYVGLEESLEKAAEIQKAGGIHAVGFKTLMEIWDYKTGTTSSVIAALKSFGLVEVSGNGDTRQVKLTETARKILADHSEATTLKKQAAVSAPLYRRLWQKFGPDLPTNDKVMGEYLEFEEHFNPASVAGVIADFRSTITYANLSESDKITDTDGEGGEENQSEPPANKGSQSNGGFGTSRNPGGVKPPVLKDGIMYSITIDVLENGQINVVTAGDLNEKTFALVSEIFGLKAKHENKTDPQTASNTKYSPNDDRYYEETEQ
ncbi:MAG: hypothetical protein UZ17_ACD001002174 [Acidobacteria bacterium OLB17]|nr:MAG: hypothetical protein UZ17_ACD001002174 [Acidobacteria bacterium OLB17]MCZ2390785.1 hypothetical protein [Acidobacteriota bacterium]